MEDGKREVVGGVVWIGPTVSGRRSTNQCWLNTIMKKKPDVNRWAVEYVASPVRLSERRSCKAREAGVALATVSVLDKIDMFFMMNLCEAR